MNPAGRHAIQGHAALVLAALSLVAPIAAAARAQGPTQKPPPANEHAPDTALEARPRVRAAPPARPQPNHPIVVIPGILGTKLSDPETGRVVWGKFFDLRALTVHESVLQPEHGAKDGLELPIDGPEFAENRDRLVPEGVLDRFSVIPHVAEVRVYEKLLAALSACGYRVGPIASCGVDSDLSVFYYDWRRDLVEAARLLAGHIRAIKENAHDPHLRVDLVAHSMGGLIAEYYLLYGGEDVLGQDPLPPPSYAGASNVRRVILIGVPQEGSVEAFHHLHGGFRVGLRTVSREAVFTMPALYELLPLEEGGVSVDSEGRPLEIDLVDAQTWQQYGFGVFSTDSRRTFIRECRRIFPGDWQDRSAEMYARFARFLDLALTRAKRFHEAVSRLAEAPPPGVEIHLVGSRALPTPARFALAATSAGWRVRFRGQALRQPGDGTVTAVSLTGGHRPGCGSGSENVEPFPTVWFAADHAHLVADPEVLRHVTELLAR